MDYKHYVEMLLILDEHKLSILQFKNGLKIKITPFSGICETSLEEGEEDYVGEHINLVNVAEIIERGSDKLSLTENNGLEINLKMIPEKVTLEDGTILWEKEED